METSEKNPPDRSQNRSRKDGLTGTNERDGIRGAARILIRAGALILWVLPSFVSAQTDAATQVLQQIEKRFESYYTGTDLTPEQKAYNENLKKEVLRDTFDVRELSRIALSPYWSELSRKDQDYFVDLLTRLLEHKAVYSKEHAKERKVKYRTVWRGDVYLDQAKTLTLTKTMVRIPSENLVVEINYKMKKIGSVWKIFDVIVDGASLLDNYCYQFCKITKEKGFRDLVGRMEKKYEELTK